MEKCSYNDGDLNALNKCREEFPALDTQITPRQVLQQKNRHGVSKNNSPQGIVPFYTPGPKFNRGLNFDRSFDGNQSFPCIAKGNAWARALEADRPDGGGLNSCTFSPRKNRASFPSLPATDPTLKIESEWYRFLNQLDADAPGCGDASRKETVPDTVLNPNKAVFIVESKTSEILVVNDFSCHLLGYEPKELCSKKLITLLGAEGNECLQLALSEDHLERTGEKISFSGKVIEVTKRCGQTIPVSVWVRKLEGIERNLVAMETVHRRRGEIYFDNQGNIIAADEGGFLLFQYAKEELPDKNLKDLIPSVQLPANGLLNEKTRKQNVTGCTKFNTVFPLSLRMSVDSGLYTAVVWAFETASGLIVVDSYGTVVSCNHHFTHFLFGYTQQDLVGLNITKIIPYFMEKFHHSNGYLNEDPVRGLLENIDSNDMTKNSSLIANMGDNEEANCSVDIQNVPLDLTKSAIDESIDNPIIVEEEPLNLVTSTPLVKNRPQFVIGSEPRTKHNRSQNGDGHQESITSGVIRDTAVHRDGAVFEITYQVRVQSLESGQVLHCIWVSRDVQDDELYNTTDYTTFDNTNFDTSASNFGASQSQISVIDSENLAEGEFLQKYTVIQQIGKGAFGCVKLAYRKQDRLLVVAKFIEKRRVFRDSWTRNAAGCLVPLEVSLLTDIIDHPNIIRLIDVIENEAAVQMVMERHGAGIDLFEFIDRRPDLDEPLSSYIFRQLVSAVQYLHSMNILHRDIKDENIIIDEHFHVKLIDFGSATFFSPEVTFSTFFGTVEYCSPEVLAGNKYFGPEVEVWSLGVTLYVLLFGENPFLNIEETLAAVLNPPFCASTTAMHLLHGMLQKDVKTRLTIKDVADHEWTTQTVDIGAYRFSDVVKCKLEELYPAKHYPFADNEEEQDSFS